MTDLMELASRVEASTKTLADVLREARISLRLTEGCMECNADDVQRWRDTVAWLEGLA